MKRWLVTVHDDYYPCGGSRDWRKVFESDEHQKALDYVRWIEEAEQGEHAYVIDLWEWIGLNDDKPKWTES